MKLYTQCMASTLTIYARLHACKCTVTLFQKLELLPSLFMAPYSNSCREDNRVGDDDVVMKNS